MKEAYNVKELIFENEENAEDIKSAMLDLINCYGIVTVADLYDMASLASSYMDNLFGWTEDSIPSIRDAKIRNVDNGYWLELPCEELIETSTKHQSYETEDQMVSHPPHYKSKSGLETIQIIEAVTEDLLGIEAWDTGNVVKYISRWKKKNGLQDLEKAMWYLTDLINHVKEKPLN